jgi:hypothetical protein
MASGFKSESGWISLSPLGGESPSGLPPWRRKRHWIFFLLAFLPATTVFPIGTIFFQLDRLGAKFPSFLEWSLIFAFGVILMALLLALDAIGTLRDRVDRLENRFRVDRSDVPARGADPGRPQPSN